MYCEICGKQIEKPITIRFNKAILKVCEECKVIGEEVVVKPVERKPIVKQQVILKKPQVRKEPEYTVREDYAREIKKARESMGITQDMLASLIGEKLSTLKKVEAGKLKPTIEMAKKLEKTLKISLLETESFEETLAEKKVDASLTLGDVIEVKED
ncbi:MAG TPA: multiprotein bridging factor aMBF1 [Geobacterales bacterium]|nr:multiprotein bridging factor aMBF1 [Geobacterales bacterium]